MYNTRNVLRELSTDGRTEPFSQSSDTSYRRPGCQKNRGAAVFAKTQRVMDY